jgi:CheY-like chemotaxis protein
MAMSDPCLAQQVLINLLLNARDALPDGGELHVSLRAMLTTPGVYLPGQLPDAQVRERYAVFSVRDSGIGIGEELRPRIFEPFVTTKPRDRGSGLGLAVTYAIVQEHGGWIHVDSAPGQGSTFTVYLPADEAEDAEDPLATSDNCRLDGMRILLVEDDEMVLALLRDSLVDAGAEVITATDVESALNRLEDGPVRLDAAVVDIDVPGGAGRDLFLRIRERSPEAKRLILSGGVLDRSLLAWADAQEIPFLLKPFQLSDLSRLIHELVTRETSRNDG